MLEIIVDLCRKNGKISGGNTTERLAGDIILAKKQPCLWGNEEKKLFLITYLKDDELEKSMEKDIIINPYGVYDKVYTSDNKIELDLVNRSKYRVNLDMFEGSDGLDPENVTQEPVKPNGKEYLELKDLIFDEEFRI
jgi:hypothetical protein